MRSTGIFRKHKINYRLVGCVIGGVACLIGGYYLGRKIQILDDDVLFGTIANSIYQGHYHVASMTDKRLGVAYDLVGVPHGQGLKILEAAETLSK